MTTRITSELAIAPGTHTLGPTPPIQTPPGEKKLDAYQPPPAQPANPTRPASEIFYDLLPGTLLEHFTVIDLIWLAARHSVTFAYGLANDALRHPDFDTRYQAAQAKAILSQEPRLASTQAPQRSLDALLVLADNPFLPSSKYFYDLPVQLAELSKALPDTSKQVAQAAAVHLLGYLRRKPETAAIFPRALAYAKASRYLNGNTLRRTIVYALNQFEQVFKQAPDQVKKAADFLDFCHGWKLDLRLKLITQTNFVTKALLKRQISRLEKLISQVCHRLQKDTDNDTSVHSLIALLSYYAYFHGQPKAEAFRGRLIDKLAASLKNPDRAFSSALALGQQTGSLMHMPRERDAAIRKICEQAAVILQKKLQTKGLLNPSTQIECAKALAQLADFLGDSKLLKEAQKTLEPFLTGEQGPSKTLAATAWVNSYYKKNENDWGLAFPVQLAIGKANLISLLSQHGCSESRLYVEELLASSGERSLETLKTFTQAYWALLDQGHAHGDAREFLGKVAGLVGASSPDVFLKLSEALEAIKTDSPQADREFILDLLLAHPQILTHLPEAARALKKMSVPVNPTLLAFAKHSRSSFSGFENNLDQLTKHQVSPAKAALLTLEMARCTRAAAPANLDFVYDTFKVQPASGLNPDEFADWIISLTRAFRFGNQSHIAWQRPDVLASVLNPDDSTPQHQQDPAVLKKKLIAAFPNLPNQRYEPTSFLREINNQVWGQANMAVVFERLPAIYSTLSSLGFTSQQAREYLSELAWATGNSFNEVCEYFLSSFEKLKELGLGGRQAADNILAIAKKGGWYAVRGLQRIGIHVEHFNDEISRRVKPNKPIVLFPQKVMDLVQADLTAQVMTKPASRRGEIDLLRYQEPTHTSEMTIAGKKSPTRQAIHPSLFQRAYLNESAHCPQAIKPALKFAGPTIKWGARRI